MLDSSSGLIKHSGYANKASFSVVQVSVAELADIVPSEIAYNHTHKKSTKFCTMNFVEYFEDMLFDDLSQAERYFSSDMRVKVASVTFWDLSKR